MGKAFIRILFLVCAAAAAGLGCTTIHSYDDQFHPVLSSYRQGNADRAATLITGKSYEKRFRSNDRLLWTLETGKLLHAAGEHAESNRYFEQAEEIIADFEERAELNVRAGLANLGALATNPAAIPYRGTYAEKILVNTYKAMNYLGLGDLEAARVEIRRAYERQLQAIEQNEAAIEAARAEASAGTRRALESPAWKRAVEIDPAVAAAYKNFANPFTTFLSGLVYLADRDPARAEIDFRVLASLPLSNPFINQELEFIEKHLQEGAPLPRRRVYVVFENGLGPAREEMRVDLILPQIGYTGFAFPQIAFQPSPVAALKVTLRGDEEPVLTERVASVDQIIATDFETQMPAMAMRTIAAVIAKEVAARQFTNQLAGSSSRKEDDRHQANELELVGMLLGSLYKAVVNKADTRTWKTLGKEFQVAAFDYPESGSLRLSLVGQNKNELSTRQEVQLPDGDIVLLLVSSVNSNDLRVTTRTLR